MLEFKVNDFIELRLEPDRSGEFDDKFEMEQSLLMHKATLINDGAHNYYKNESNRAVEAELMDSIYKGNAMALTAINDYHLTKIGYGGSQDKFLYFKTRYGNNYKRKVLDPVATYKDWIGAGSGLGYWWDTLSDPNDEWEVLGKKKTSLKTTIYVVGERFRTCSFLLINIQGKGVSRIDNIDSIDEASEMLSPSLHYNSIKKLGISPETEFWAHCSNLQAWAENDYDTRILYRNLAFPLLKKLTEAGDLKARKAFRKEIASRLRSGNETVIDYLFHEKYVDFLEKRELMNSLLEENDASAIIELLKVFKDIPWFSLGLYFSSWFWLDDYPYNEPDVGDYIIIKDRRVIKISLHGSSDDFTLKEFPEPLLRLGELREIRLRGKIGQVPEAICQLKNLEELNLSFNDFRDFPETLAGLPSLKILDLSYNRIETLPDSISKLSSLRRLRLSNNPLKKLPNSLAKLEDLEVINLLNNHYLEKLPETLGSLTLDKENHFYKKRK